MKRTKTKLLSSIAVLIVCFAMLIGSTFAWFTDSASTGVNKIQAGNLDVQLLMWNGADYVDISDNTKPIFGSDSSLVAKNDNSNTLWEPGKTQVAYLAIKNNGNLALKYKVQLDVANKNDKNMSNAMLYAITPNATNSNPVSSWTGGTSVIDGSQFVSNETTLEVGVTHYFALSIHMKEDAGNQYQGGKVDFDLTVLATQQTAESDSFNNQYDSDSKYPNIMFRESVPVVLDSDNKVAQEKKVESIKKDENNNPLAIVTIPQGAAIENGTDYVEVIVEEVDTPSTFTVSASSDVTTYEIDVKGVNKAVNTELFRVELKVGKNLDNFKLYHNTTPMASKTDLADVTADQQYYYDSSEGIVTLLTKTFSPFTGTYDKESWDNHAAAAYSTPVNNTNKMVTIKNAEELALFAKEVSSTVNYSNYTIEILNDIDLSDYTWNPINGWGRMSGITINGNGKTISNMIVCNNYKGKSGGFGVGFIGNTNGSITFNNLTFDNAFVSFYKTGEYNGNVGGIVMGYTYGTTIFNNVNVMNSEIHGYGKIGAILGMGADPGVKVTFNNCVSKNNTIAAVYDMGGLAGLIQRKNGQDYTTVENCTVDNITVKLSTNDIYVDLDNVIATFKTNDKTDGDNIQKSISGNYWMNGQYYYGGYADYYVSYGDSSYDPPIQGEEAYLANSEICFNK